MLYPKISSQRNKSNVNIFSTNLLNPEKVETKKKCLIEKFTTALKLKHAKLFKGRGYTTNMLVADLNELISLNEFDNFNYNAYMFKLDKDILNKLLPMPLVYQSESNTDKKNQNNSSKLENDLLQKKPAISIDVENNQINKLLEDFNTQVLSQHNQKLLELKHKEQDEWGRQARNEYLKFQQEKEEKKKKTKEKNLELQETLQKQVQEKKIRENSEDVEKYFFEIQKNINEKFDEKERKKHNMLKDKYREIEKNRQNFISDKKRLEVEAHNLELKKDLNLIENFKKELEMENNKKNKKKEAEREHFKKSFENNSLRNAYLNNEKLKEKMENEKIQKEFKELTEKQDKDRENYFNSIKQKFKKNGEVTSISISQYKLMRELEDKKTLKEIEEQELR